jgi:hypothetical protein
VSSFHSQGEVAAEIKVRLALNTTALGAETDIGRKVYRGKRTIAPSLVPCTSILEGDDQAVPETKRTTYLVTTRYAVLAYVECDDEEPELNAHAAIRDIKRRLFMTNNEPDATLGKKAKEVLYLGKQIAPRADGEKFVLVVVEFTVTIVENVANP